MSQFLFPPAEKGLRTSIEKRSETIFLARRIDLRHLSGRRSAKGAAVTEA